VGVEAVLEPGQDFRWLGACAAADDMPEVVEAFDAGGRDDQRFGGAAAVGGERVRGPGRDDQQIPGPCGDHIVLDQQVERTTEDVEQLGGVIVTMRSASIHTLERELGAELFIRDSRHVMLTPAGRALLPAARRALTAAGEGRDAVAGVRGVLRGQLHIGAIQTLGVLDPPALLTSFSRAHPDVTLRLSHDAAATLARAAADAQLDIAFIDGPTDPARVTRVEIGHDDLVLAVSRADPLAARTSIQLGDPALRDRSFVDYRADSALHAQIDVACAAAGLARRTVCEAQNMQYLAELVQHGLGISVLPPMSVRAVTAAVRTVPITPPIRRDICAVVAAGQPPTGAAQALLGLFSAGTGRGQPG
jgi:DNA-binding transcriptional LysR family regulator